MDITSALPASLRTGTTLIEVDGRLTAWLMPDGRVFPYVAGGDEGEDGGDQPGEGDDKGGADDNGGENNNVDNKDTVSMSQADLDALIGKRLSLAKAEWEKDAETKADRDKMDEADRLKAEKADAEKATQDAMTKANERIVRASAKVTAVDLGANPKRVDALLRLADLTDVTVGDDGEPDAPAVKAALEAALKEYPEFKASAAKGNGASGGEHKSGGDSKPSSLKEAVAQAMA